MTMRLVAELLTQAGVPPGVFNMVQGTAEARGQFCRGRAAGFVRPSGLTRALKEDLLVQCGLRRNWYRSRWSGMRREASVEAP